MYKVTVNLVHNGKKYSIGDIYAGEDYKYLLANKLIELCEVKEEVKEEVKKKSANAKLSVEDVNL